MHISMTQTQLAVHYLWYGCFSC